MIVLAKLPRGRIKIVSGGQKGGKNRTGRGRKWRQDWGGQEEATPLAAYSRNGFYYMSATLTPRSQELGEVSPTCLPIAKAVSC